MQTATMADITDIEMTPTAKPPAVQQTRALRHPLRRPIFYASRSRPART
jgi:hypothetical protein